MVRVLNDARNGCCIIRAIDLKIVKKFVKTPEDILKAYFSVARLPEVAAIWRKPADAGYRNP